MEKAETVEKEEEKIIFTLIEKYEDVIKALEDQNAEYKSQLQELSHSIRDIINENSHLILELKDSLNNEISTLENVDRDEDEDLVANIQHQLDITIREKEQILQAWQLALREIERLETKFEERDIASNVNGQKSLKNDYIRIVTSLNATINELREEIKHHENEINMKDIYTSELKMMIESMKEQIMDKEQEIDGLKQNENEFKIQIKHFQEQRTELQLKATESLREILDFRDNNTVLQEQTKGLIKKNTSLEIRENELIQQMKESLQIAEDAMLEKDTAHMKMQNQQTEINQLKDALAQIVDEAGIRTKKEVDKVQKMFENKISRLENDIKSFELETVDLKMEAERATRDKINVETQLEKLEKEMENGELQQAYQQLHTRLVTTERNSNVSIMELDAIKAKMKLMQTRHKKEIENYEIDKKHFQDKILWLETECESHLDSKIQLACQVESLEALKQELRTELNTCKQNLDNYMATAETEKLTEDKKWRDKLNTVEEYYRKSCDEFRQLLDEQHNLGLRWKSEMKRASQTWNNKFSNMELDLVRYKNRNSELSNLLKERVENTLKQQTRSLETIGNPNKMKKNTVSDDIIYSKIKK